MTTNPENIDTSAGRVHKNPIAELMREAATIIHASAESLAEFNADPITGYVDEETRDHLSEEHGIAFRLRSAADELERQEPGYPGISEGWKLVPVEPTAEMGDAAMNAEDYSNRHRGEPASFIDIWDAMLDAAPQPAEQKADERQEPVAWMDEGGALHTTAESAYFRGTPVTPLYARPPAVTGQAIPEGWRLAPFDPHPRQLEVAAFNLCRRFGNLCVEQNEEFARAAYKELLAAAPEPPTESKGEDEFLPMPASLRREQETASQADGWDAEAYNKMRGEIAYWKEKSVKAEELKPLVDKLVEALEKYEAALHSLFVQCLSNPVTNAWGKPVDLSLLNDASLAGTKALAAYRKQGGDEA